MKIEETKPTQKKKINALQGVKSIPLFAEQPETSERVVKHKPDFYSQVSCLPGTLKTPKPMEPKGDIGTRLKMHQLTTREQEKLIRPAVKSNNAQWKSSTQLLNEALASLNK